jgi:hypothetical protein
MSEDPRQYLNDNEEASRLMLEGWQSKVWTAMPGIVQSVDLDAMTCTVQVAIQGRFEDQNGNIQFVNISLLQDVPIVFPGAGGFTITFPIAANDEVLVVFSARCIDSWWQNGGYENVPMEYRMHDLSDGFAIPGPKSQPNVVNVDAANLVIQKNDGSVSIKITPSGEIDIVAPSGVKITGDLKVTGEVTAKSGTTNIDLSGHKHTGVTTGSGTTGGPVP